MSKMTITDSILTDIADSIRGKLGVETTYRPGDMPEAIDSIPSEMGTKSIVSNGTYEASNDNLDGYSSVSVNVPNTYGSSEEGKVVSHGALIAQTSRTVTQNSTYDTTLNNSVIVNVDGGGSGERDNIDIAFDGAVLDFNLQATGLYYGEVSQLQNVKSFIEDYANAAYPSASEVVTIPKSAITEQTSTFLDRFFVRAEYTDNVSSQMIEDLGLVLLGDFSTGGLETGNALLDAIGNYSGVLLNGIYKKLKTSQYNTTVMVVAPTLNEAYWAGMKDRNSTYTCYVTFTDGQTVSLSGNKQVVIYGIP